MPLYEYECSACGHNFEVIRKFSDPPEEKCPKCGGLVRKLQSAPAFQFKGTGWYVTDYAKSKDGRKPEGKADADGKKDAVTETSSKADSSTSGSSSPATSTTPAASGTAASKSGE